MIDLKLKKKEAVDFLGRKGRRIEIIFFGLILVFVSLLPIFLWSYLDYIFTTVIEYCTKGVKLTESLNSSLALVAPILSLAIALLFVIFVTLPVFSCFFGHSYRIYRDGMAGERKYFALGEQGYFGAMRSGAVIFGILALSLAPVIILVTLGTHFVFFDDERVSALVSYLFFLIVAAGLALGFLVFLLFRPLFLFGYYTARGKKVGEALSLSVKRMRSPRAKQIYKEYIKAFLPSLLLSLVTVLVLFLLDTLPKMSMVYFDIADDIIYGEQQ